MERKKGHSKSNRMILIHSYVRKFFKKQHTRCSGLQTDVAWMRAVAVWMRSLF